MAWLNPFLLGRPGYETSLEINPMEMQIDPSPLVVRKRNLVGKLLKGVLCNEVPIITLKTNNMSLNQRNILESLIGIQDTMLSFQCRNDWKIVAEYDLSQTATQVVLQENSITRLSAALVNAGFAGDITINNVYTDLSAGGSYGSPGYGQGPYSGPLINYFTGGSYDDVSRTITLGTALPGASTFVYVDYTYNGWLVDMKKIAHSTRGGYVDIFPYDIQLIGA